MKRNGRFEWKEPSQWKGRQKVFEMMKREFDVNLYHESK
ncbi:DUF2663 family protein [Fredinandcohnia humi]